MQTIKLTIQPSVGKPTYTEKPDKNQNHLPGIIFPAVREGWGIAILSPEFRFEKENVNDPSNPDWSDDEDIYDPAKENEEIYDPNKDKEEQELPTRQNVEEIFPEDDPDEKDDRSIYVR